MSSTHKNLSLYDPEYVPDGKGRKIGIVVSRWNERITGALLDGAVETLQKHGVLRDDIHIYYVPGSFELPLGAQWLIRVLAPDAVICLGCVIQGETRHFDFVCNAVSDGISRVSLEHDIPVIFGVLTTNSIEQASDRAGGMHGNKGIEGAVAALQMIDLRDHLKH